MQKKAEAQKQVKIQRVEYKQKTAEQKKAEQKNREKWREKGTETIHILR